jgi:hypothetical protein
MWWWCSHIGWYCAGAGVHLFVATGLGWRMRIRCAGVCHAGQAFVVLSFLGWAGPRAGVAFVGMCCPLMLVWHLSGCAGPRCAGVAFIMLAFTALGWPSSCWSSLSCWRGVRRIGVPAAVSVMLAFVLAFVLVSSSWHSSCFVQAVSSSWRSLCFVLAVSSSWWCCHAGARAVS